MNTIPDISYSILDLPDFTSQEKWELDVSRAILLLHDYQKFFLRNLNSSLLQALLKSTDIVLEWARTRDIPVVFSGQLGYKNPGERGILKDVWGRGMSTDACNIEIPSEISQKPEDYFVVKQRYSAFASTNLDNIMRLNRRDQLILCGVYGAIGITATAFDCVNKDIQSFLVPDAIVDFDFNTHINTINTLSKYTSDIICSNQFSGEVK